MTGGAGAGAVAGGGGGAGRGAGGGEGGRGGAGADAGMYKAVTCVQDHYHYRLLVENCECWNKKRIKDKMLGMREVDVEFSWYIWMYWIVGVSK